MADRYWLGGNWSLTSSWSATINGASGASVPTFTDNAYWHSIPASSTYTVDVASSCLNLDFTGATNSPNLVRSAVLSIHGNCTFISSMSVTGNSGLQIVATTTGKTFKTNGLSIASTGAMSFNGVGGEWTLQDNLTTASNIAHANGTLITNGKTVTCVQFTSTVTNTRVMILGNSTLNASSSVAFASTGLTLNAGTSTINVTGSTTFAGGGLTFYTVTLSGTTVTVSGSNIFRSLNFTAGKTVSLTSGTTQSFTNFSAAGTLGNLITIQSTTPGSAASLSRNGGIVNFNYCTIKDITATGGATFNAYNSVDGGGNTGINFLGGNPPTGYSHKIMGQTITKVNGVTPSKVNGV